ncbi:glycosyltransferase [Parageobacillus toebii]|uniref:glycosyltransferase n=1 Tax=Parageobacillus toebii TaxID=153151 RepID=UPI0035C66960
MKSEKKIMMVSTMFPYPIDNGKKVVISGILEYLLDNFKEVNYIIIGEKDNEQQYLEQNPNIKVDYISQPSLLNKIFNLFWFTILSRKKTIQESMLYSRRIKNIISQKVNEYNPDILLFDTVRTGQYISENYNCEKIIYLDDLFSIRYQKMIETINLYNVKFDALGNFKKFVPKIFRKLIDNKFIQKQVLSLEKKLMEASENRIVTKFDKNLLINFEEVKLLKFRTGQENIYEIKPVVDSVKITRNYLNSKTFVFLGALNIPHNSFSIKYFIYTQIEKILELVPDFELLIIGKNADEELLSLIKKYDCIKYMGYVEDLSNILSSACAMLIPLMFGTGVKLKTIEALNMGIPIISTSYGTEGIKLENGINCIIEDDINNFPQKIKDITDVNYNMFISQNAKIFFEEKYSKEKIYHKYNKIFNYR